MLKNITQKGTGASVETTETNEFDPRPPTYKKNLQLFLASLRGGNKTGLKKTIF